MADDVLNVGAAGPSYRWPAGGSIRRTRVRDVPLAGETLGGGDERLHAALLRVTE